MSEKYVLQNDLFDCGVAALKTIFNIFGKKIEINFNSRNNNQGLTAYEIIKLSKKNGLEAKGVKANLSYLSEKYLPCIAHVIKDKSYFHYIVILKNNKMKNKLTIFDPSIGTSSISYNEFNEITTNIFIIFKKEKIKNEKNNQFRQILLKLAKNNKILIFKSILISIIVIILSLVFSFYIKFLFIYKNYYIILSILFLFISISKNFLFYIKNKLIIKLNEKIDYDINNDFITHIFNLPYNYYQTKPTGYLITIINDIENFKSIVVKTFTTIFIDFTFIILIIIFLSIFNLYYLLILLLFVIIKIVISYLFQDKYNNNYIKTKLSKISSTTFLINSLDNIKSVKNLSIENIISKKAKEKELLMLSEKQIFNKNNSKYLSINIFLEETFLVIIIFLTFILKNDSASLLNMVIFINCYQLFLGFLNNVCDYIIMYKTYISSIEKVLDIMEEKTVEQEKRYIVDFNKIEFLNISYNLPGGNNIFNNVSFIIEKNDSIFIEGKSGVGKTTLIKLLLKEIGGYKGNILLDNINLSYISESTIRKSIVYVSNNEKLFSDTIYNNLSIVNNDENKIKKVLNICKIEDFMKKRHIDGNYFIDNTEENLSGGEKNKILIARALLNDPKVIIFDESFNEMDSKTERSIINEIKQNFNITIVFISHRKENIDLFNKHYKIENRKLIKIKEENIWESWIAKN